MAKFKPHKGLKKRVKVSGAGKVMRQSAFAAHLMSPKPGSRRQRLRNKKPLRGRYAVRARRALALD